MTERGNLDLGATDRRAHPRKAVKLRILFQRAGRAHFVEATTDNLSLGGVFIATRRRPLDVGTELSVLLEDGESELMLFGKVQWASDPSPDAPDARGMGVEFHSMGDEERARLETLLESLDGSP